MFKATLRSFLAHKGRLFLSVLAITLATAFVAGTFMFTDTITRTFDRIFASANPDVTVSPADTDAEADAISGRTASLPAETVGTLRAQVPDAQEVMPEVLLQSITVVDAGNETLNPEGPPTVLGTWYEADWSPLELTSGTSPDGDEVIVDADTAENKDVAVGDTLRIIAGTGEYRASVSGIASFSTTNPGAAYFMVDLPTAQEVMGQGDALTNISLQAVDGVSNEELKEQVLAALGDGYTVETREEAAATQSEEIGEFLSFIRYGMLGFAGISLLVGGFLIVNTFGMLIAQRTREVGLLRAVGATSGQVRRSILIEAVLLGVVGATLGLGAGAGIALLLIWLMSTLGMNLKGTELAFTPATVIAAYAVGILITVVAALVPARRASRISPMAALTEAAAPAARPLAPRVISGVLLGAAGTAGLGAAIQADGAASGLLFGAGVLLTLLAAVLVGPALAKAVVPVLSWPFIKAFGSVGRLGQQNVLRNPRRANATAAALMIGLALASGTSIFASSMKTSFFEQIDNALGADFQVGGSFNAPPQPFPGSVAEAVRDVDGVETVTRQRMVQATMSGDQDTQVMLNAVDTNFGEAMTIDYAEGDGEQALRGGELIVTEDQATELGVAPGDVVPLDFGSGVTAELTVGAISQGGQAMNAVSIDTLEDLLPGTQDVALMVTMASGADATAVEQALGTALEPYPQVELRDQTEIKDEVAGQVDFLLYLVWGLLALSIIIAILGVINTLALSVVERTREVGLLRAVGTTRIQIRRMVRLESVMIAVYGATLGLVLGLAWGVAGQRLLAGEGLTELTIPWDTIAYVLVGAAAVGLVAAIGPAVRASRMNVLGAIATE
ncbi:ABC transporter permease [Haloechinothrix sp. YIM 98757]|uniref:ABC transporter permease n=1 Tax=Haloechinothrix aidingensis TaxID=2752311 RepID=A0A838A230_9PSEU|nr:ABC transporter permease [Haloechinothrix aidingensis]MBA0125223.1 ABC transporter permease [Haloechinothrix aidingensis]